MWTQLDHNSHIWSWTIFLSLSLSLAVFHHENSRKNPSNFLKYSTTVQLPYLSVGIIRSTQTSPLFSTGKASKIGQVSISHMDRSWSGTQVTLIKRTQWRKVDVPSQKKSWEVVFSMQKNIPQTCLLWGPMHPWSKSQDAILDGEDSKSSIL